MKTGLLYGIVANSKTRVRCVFCGVYIPKANKCIEQHTNGVKHKENIEIMSQNGIHFNSEILYCRPCKVNLEQEESVAKHIEGDDHANWMLVMEDLIDGEFINTEAYLSCEKDDVFCEVCNSNIPCTLSNIEDHVNGLHHRSNVVVRLKPLNGIFPVDNNEEVWCKVCDTFIENTVQRILQHIDVEQQHVEWFAEIEDFIEGQGISIEDYLSNEYENNIYCNKCQVEIECDTRSIDDHINSETHLNHFS